MKHIYAALVALCVSFSSDVFSQLIINNATNAVEAVNTFLLGDGVDAFNITYTGNNDQIASFTCNGCNLGLGSGVVMSSGNANTAAGPNNAGGSSTSYGGASADPDLDAISAMQVFDASILTFEFIPTGDEFTFRFVFGSDEYPEYTNSNFNDAFGFFLSGPGISGPYQNGAINIALIPGTTLPVSINNVNNGNAGTNGPCEYCQYYIHNGTGTQAPFNSSNLYIQPDGFTTVLEATASVQCGETYRIKLAIADGGDSSFNSWVFLEANSFTSNNLDVGFNQSNVAPSVNAVYEGCAGGEVVFTRPPGLVGDATFNLTFAGTATNGVDYEEMPSQIFFPDGVDEVVIPFVGIFDGTTEGQETVIINVEAPVTCAGTATINLFINEVPALNAFAADQVFGCTSTPQIAVIPSGGIGQYQVTWNTGQTGSVITVPLEAAEYTYTVTDVCGVSDVTGTVEVTLQQYAPLTVNIGGDQEVTCLDNLLINPNVSGGAGGNEFQWTVDGATYSSTQVLNWFVTGEATIGVTVTDDCGTEAVSEISVTVPAVPVNVNLGEDVNADCLGTVVIDADVSGGVGNYTYEWLVDGVSAGSATSIEFVPGAGASVVLNVEDECGNIGTDNLEVTVISEPVTVVIPQVVQGTCLDQLTISSTVNGGAGGYIYQWFADGLPVGNGTELTIDAQDDLNITLQVTDQCGGSGVGESVVEVPPVPVILNLGSAQQAPCFAPVTFNPEVSGGVGSYSYSWSVDGTFAGSSSTLTVEAVEGLQVSLTVTDACGNSSSDNSIVSVIPTPINITLPATQAVTCLSNFTLNPQVTGGTGNLQFTWSVDGVVVGNNATYTFNTDEPLTISVEVSDLCGNVASDVINITVNPATINLTLTPDQEICPGDNAVLAVTPSGGIGSYSYAWSTGGSGSQVTVSPSDDATYSVAVTDACGNAANASVDVDVLIPDVPLTSVGEVELCPGVGSSTLFEGGVLPLSLSFSADSLTHNGSGGFTGVIEGSSIVVVSDFCGAVTSIDVTITPCSITIPNVFTPNGDNKNNNFEIVGISGFPGSELLVYNRWGKLVYESANYDNSWSARDLPEGTYYYILKRSDGENYEGYVQILR
jgi:gliding motility-associated-like protein